MRFTTVLLRESHRWRFKKLWEVKGAYTKTKLIKPSFLEDHNIDAVDANEVVKPEPLFPRWEPPVKDDPRFMPPKKPEDDPNYHEQHIYEFMERIRLIEGEKQACILTKSQPFYEMPETVKRLQGTLSIPDQDLLIQRVIMQANIWNPIKVKLPRRFDPRLPGWRFKAEYGIPNAVIASVMVKNLVRLCQTAGAAYPRLMDARAIAYDPYISVYYFAKGDEHISIKGLHELLISADKPLPPYAGEDVVDQTVGHTLPDIFPVLPTIDLSKQHIWKEENITGWNAGYSHRYPHTLFLTYNNRWSNSQRNAQAVMYCFAHCLGLAKEKYGPEVQTLPEPISVQCVMTNGIDFQFIFYQLNTLNFDGADGVKNIVWFDKDNAMYKKILPKRAMLRNTRYEDYDPEVFQKLLSMYCYGEDLSVVASSEVEQGRKITMGE